jgi:murein DD-endopeptidase MepM/ murein hydrolase activator NlpD
VIEIVSIGLGLIILAIQKKKPKWKILIGEAVLENSKTKLVDRGTITSRYLERRSPTHLHRGIDIAAPLNTNIYSVQDGKIIGIYHDGERRGYGNCILILHPDGFSSFYAHLNSFSPNVFRGVYVNKGDYIGKIGATGTQQMKPHLHFEVIKNLKFENPFPPIHENTPRMDPIEYLLINNVVIGR